jgi:hypothetical protein
MSTYDYTTLDRVKRILRSVNSDPSVQKKIHFSDSHSLPKKYSTNTGTGMLLDVDVKGDYVGYEHWKIVFSSSVAFTLYRGEDELSTDGSGTTSANFTSSSGVITILTTYWTGVFSTGDSFTFDTLSNISNADAEQYISDAEDIVNTTLEEYIGSTNIPFKSTIPAKITTGTAYIAAFLIYGGVFSTMNEGAVPEFVNRWFRVGNGMVSSYLETISGRLLRHAKFIPRFITREPLFDKVGVEDATGIGLTPGDDKGEIDTVNVEYDEFYNTEEGGN